MDVDIYYDGVNLEEFAGHRDVSGFTTNTGFMKTANISDFETFGKWALKRADGRPISFQTFGNNTEEIVRQAKVLSSWGDNVWVKVPVVNEDGNTNIEAIKELGEEGVKVNITTVFTHTQMYMLREQITKAPTIISVFAGRISDAGKDPMEYICSAVLTMMHLDNVQILWAGCQSVYDVIRADTAGAHIITVPDAPMRKLNRIGKDLHDFSVETSKGFSEDARAVGLNL
jgi:transaldolase